MGKFKGAVERWLKDKRVVVGGGGVVRQMTIEAVVVKISTDVSLMISIIPTLDPDLDNGKHFLHWIGCWIGCCDGNSDNCLSMTHQIMYISI